MLGREARGKSSRWLWPRAEAGFPDHRASRSSWDVALYSGGQDQSLGKSINADLNTGEAAPFLRSSNKGGEDTQTCLESFAAACRRKGTTYNGGTPNNESPSGIGFRISANGPRTPEPRLGSVRLFPKPLARRRLPIFSFSSYSTPRGRSVKARLRRLTYRASSRRSCGWFRARPLSLRWFHFRSGYVRLRGLSSADGSLYASSPLPRRLVDRNLV